MSAEILKEARDIVAKGWIKGDYTDDQGNYCALGALGEAVMRNGLFPYVVWETRTRLQDHLPDLGWKGRKSVAEFNDHPDTTHEMVLQLFDKAIANYE
ncbi:hypothetical protein SEA_YEET_125 [Mycobacterium phage Yeet]|uniref:Uncharacterized protein n=2 Tax=Omegavirus courthouse TaxID=1089119 RepID=G8I5I3_9CAUD|nr:hypothetical protein CM09_gp126 [Mycobacterium phage Courthouse]ATS92969.1 hypothetical protein SEA_SUPERPHIKIMAN_128 [Mycobacterium phage Superphikiman]QDM55709.1 hypothetical protein SEA_HOKKEND_123 [Mycobacterium phage HokkenD]QED12278.1 hypothetical protein SEA_YEET_125 [Mycobacterium phage Yeet]QGJ93765.1 hypothetical protein SEA_HANNACONDA_124 [Mycobacterium phage Hannaconda]AER47977.1 hypothetical protein COURTHOUSE_126 [Mycobacterium phage Courthouse]